MIAMNDLAARLAAWHSRHLYRTRTLADGRTAVRRLFNGRRLLSFCSNDYLGLASDARLITALQKGAELYGVGAGASFLVNGYTTAHRDLEEQLAQWTGRERALLFSTGYMANLGVFSALANRHSVVLQDRDNHASLLDASMLSRARHHRYRHGDVQALATLLAEKKKEHTIVATEAVFSMDGSVAPLPELASLCQKHHAWLVVDDAHGFGVVGEHGGGTLEQMALSPQQVPVVVGTFGKALGTMGAFVAGSADLIETIIQAARSYIYTTAPAPALAYATRAALDIVIHEDWRRKKLQRHIQRFRQIAQAEGLAVVDSNSPIQALIVGTAQRALAVSSALAQQGIQVTAIRPPTVPVGSARLRITLSSAHEEKELEHLCAACRRAIKTSDAGSSAASSLGGYDQQQ